MGTGERRQQTVCVLFTMVKAQGRPGILGRLAVGLTTFLSFWSRGHPREGMQELDDSHASAEAHVHESIRVYIGILQP